MLTFIIYLIGIADSLKILFAVVAVGLLCSAFIGFIAAVDGEYVHINMAVAKKNLTKIGAIALVFAFLSAAIPNSKTLSAMIIIPALVEDKNLKNIAGNGVQALEILTEQWLKELKMKNEGK